MSDEKTEPDQLSARDMEILEFERLWWKHAGAKAGKILERWGWSEARYYQALNTLLERPAALEYDAQLVNRLRRIREKRQQQRQARRLGFDV